jgi:hypothetical protein
MENSDLKLTCGDFNALRQVVSLTGISGTWTKGKITVNFVSLTGRLLANLWNDIFLRPGIRGR